MKRNVKIFFGVIFTAIIFLNFTKCFAEDLRFIDANDDTGYYVDASTIRVESDSVFYVNLNIIRASINQLEVVNLKINHWAKTYQAMSIRTLSYDERTELKFDDAYRVPLHYAEKSLMADVVRFVLVGSL